MVAELSTKMVSPVLVARQAISDAGQRTFAYELLYRSSAENYAVITNHQQATADVIVNAFMEIGLERLVGPRLAFINVSSDFIIDGHIRSLPRDRVVLEILEDAVAEPKLMAAVREFRAAGYRFALDDFTFRDESMPLLQYSEFVKLDLQQLERRAIEHHLSQLRERRYTIAEKVETREEYEFCKSCGFDYFQGYYFCKPHIVSASATRVNRVAILRLLAKLQDPDITARELESVVGEDLSLSYKLLRYINSVYVGLSRTIESVGHAVRLVGTEHIRLLATLIMLSTMSNKPQHLVALSLVRAKMCESLASHLKLERKETFFTVGLFSTVDAFLDCSMTDALESLPFSEDIRQALLRHKGPCGEILNSVMHYERGNFDETFAKEIGSATVQRIYWNAVDWQQHLFESLPAVEHSVTIA